MVKKFCPVKESIRMNRVTAQAAGTLHGRSEIVLTAAMQFHLGPLIQSLSEARLQSVGDGRLRLFAGELSLFGAEIILCVSAGGSGSREGLVNDRATYDRVVPTIVFGRAYRQPDAAIVCGLDKERLYRLPGHVLGHCCGPIVRQSPYDSVLAGRSFRNLSWDDALRECPEWVESGR